MAVSPYRFDPGTGGADRTARSRVGLSSITSGAASGGEGYRASALRPGSSGFMAATFGGAPRTDYVRPTTTATVTAAPTATQTAAPTLVPTYNDATGAEGGNTGMTGGATGFDAGGQPGVGPDLDIGGRDVGRVLGGVTGGLLAGPGGALAGGFLGGRIGGSFDTPASPAPTAQPVEPGINPNPDPGYDGQGLPSAETLGGLDAQAQANIDNGVAGLATGGRVGPRNLRKDMPMQGAKPGGLRHVQAGGRPFMGAYAAGGRVPNYADGGAVDGAGLAGPNPPGPDDGYAALDGGEFVVRQAQAQRPEYASILDQINQGTYDPDAGAPGDGMGAGTTPGRMPAEGGQMGPMGGGDPSSLPPDMQMALGQAMQADPNIAAALTTLLGPEAVHEIMECCGGMGMGEDVAEGAHETPDGRPPLAGPAPPPGINAPPGVRPPPAANPTMPMPPGMGGLRGIAA